MWRSVGGLGAITLVVVALLLVLTPRLSFVEMRALDFLLSVTRPAKPDRQVELVDVGPDSTLYEAYRVAGDEPPDGCEIPRSAYAEAARKLRHWGAKVVVFDLMFRRRCEIEDAKLAAAFRQAGNVVVAAPTETKPGAVKMSTSVEPINSAVWGTGCPMAYTPNQDVRSVAMLVRDYDTGTPFLALSLLALQRFEGVKAGETELREGHSLVTADRRVPLLAGEAVYLLPPRNAPRQLQAGAGGDSGIEVAKGSVEESFDTWNTMLINWAGPKGTFAPHILADLLTISDAQGRETFAGKAVVIGRMDWDEHYSAMGKMPGPEVQANAINTLITGEFISPLTPYAALGLVAFLAALTSAGVRQLRGWRSLVATAFVLAALTVVAAQLLARSGVWLYLFTCGAAVVLAWGITTVGESAKVVSLLTRFVPQFLGRADRQRAGEIRSLDATMIFSDIRGFTSTAEQIEHQDMLAMLNLFHSAMEDIITRHGGTIVKTPGDAILAVFWRDVKKANHATCAVRAGQEMLANMPALARAWESSGVKLEVGVGVNSGPVAMGLVGTHHLEPTVIGDAVNVSQRLESLTKDVPYLMIFSESTRELLQDEVEAVNLEEIALKGRQVPIRCYGVVGPGGLAGRETESAGTEGNDEGEA